MRVIRRFRAYCRLVDATIDRTNQVFVPPLQTRIILATAVLLFYGLAAGAATLVHRLPFALGMLSSIACAVSAVAVSWTAAYRNWLTAQRRLKGQCPHCGFDLRHSPQHCPECGSPVCDADRKHMTVIFTATQAGAVSEPNFTKIWLASDSPRHLLTFQRQTISPDSSQVYLTFDLEPHSTPGRIVTCALEIDRLHVQITGYFNNRYDHFDVALTIPPDQLASLAHAVRSILLGTGARLSSQLPHRLNHPSPRSA